LLPTSSIILTRRNEEALQIAREDGYQVTTNNVEAVQQSQIIILAVIPSNLKSLLLEIAPVVTSHHTLISIVTGAEISSIKQELGYGPEKNFGVVRAMPNTAIAHQESMTCLASDSPNSEHMNVAQFIFNALGICMVIKEDHIIAATALCACGIAFFCRAIRAAAQGGVEIGFHSNEAIRMAAQTAKGAASLILEGGKHPEEEVDKVTTPMGCTIAGLNEMEHNRFSSSFIKGIVTSAEVAKGLYNDKKKKQ